MLVFHYTNQTLCISFIVIKTFKLFLFLLLDNIVTENVVHYLLLHVRMLFPGYRGGIAEPDGQVFTHIANRLPK